MINSFCRFLYFKVLRWSVVGDLPTEKKYLFVILPHTSNWDFIYGWLAIRALDLKLTIFVKDAYYVFPLNLLCKFFGAAPVNRRESTNFVDSIAQQYAQNDVLAAVITPEGTRKFTPTLKSGYYYLAKKAGVPLVVAGPNYRDKNFTILPSREVLGSFEEDSAALAKFSMTVVGKNPEQAFRE